MKNKLKFGFGVMMLIFLCLPVTAAAEAQVGVAYRGHIQDVGDYPADGSWVESPEIIGTVGQAKRIEGFEIKLSGTAPAGMVIRYNVHVQNKGWLYDENDTSDWPRNGDYAGTRGESLRIEAVKIVLTDADGQAVSDYSVRYRGHVQNRGDWPADASQWLADGGQLGTVGSSLRLEALQVTVVKTAVDPPPPVSVVYDSAGTFGPDSGSETISGDATVAADGVTLQNLTIAGDLTISATVGDGTVTLNNVTVTGDTFVRGGGVNSIHINGGSYKTIVMEKTASGAVRIVATDAAGLAVVIAEDAAGETIILEGAFDSVIVNAPEMNVTTQGTTAIETMTVAEGAAGSTVTVAAGTTVSELVLAGQTAVKGQGTVAKAEIKVDGVVFDKAPDSYSVAPGVAIPPVFPAPEGGIATPRKILLTISEPILTTTRDYDGTTDVAVTAGTLSGVAAGDAGNVTVTASASYESKDAGARTINISYTLSGPAKDHYLAPANETRAGTITPKRLTVPMVWVEQSKVYDGDASAAVPNGCILEGVVAAEVVGATASASYDNKNVASNKPITVSFSLTGDATVTANYRAPADNTDFTGEITTRPLTITTAPTVTLTKVYDGNATAAVIADGTTDAVASDQVTATATASYADAAVNPNKTITVVYSLSGDDAGNYRQPAERQISGAIDPKPLSYLLSTDHPTKVYDQTTAAPVSASNLTGIVDSEAVSIASTTATYHSKDVGTAKRVTVSCTLTGPDSGNYLAPDVELTTGEITAVRLAATPVTVTTAKVYDGTCTAAITAGGTVTGALPGETVSATATASYDNKDVADNKTITVAYTLTGSATDQLNYCAPAGYTASTSGRITARPLTIRGPTIVTSKPYDGTTAAMAVAGSLNEQVAGDDVTVTATAAYDTATHGNDKTITVVHTLAGTDSLNYTAPANYVTNRGVITPKQLTVNGQHLTTEKGYDGNTTAKVDSVILSGVVPGEMVYILWSKANYDNSDLGINKTITVVYTISDPAGNYLPPVNYTTNTGVIKKDILVTSYDSTSGTWSALTTDFTPTITALPHGYTIFDLDNSGNVYAGHSDGTIKKYIYDSWSTDNMFSGPPPAGAFKFVGINLVARPIVAFGVTTATNQLYSNTRSAWKDEDVIVGAGYQAQVVGAYATNDSDGFIVLMEGSSLKQIDMNDDSFAVQPLAPLPSIPAGYAICGFNVTRGKLNLYLTR
jgi:hypothetical protein